MTEIQHRAHCADCDRICYVLREQHGYEPGRTDARFIREAAKLHPGDPIAAVSRFHQLLFAATARLREQQAASDRARETLREQATRPTAAKLADHYFGGDAPPGTGRAAELAAELFGTI